MKTHRFIVGALPDEPKFQLEDRDVVHQIRTVLKLKKGETIVLADGQRSEVEARIVDVGAHGIEVEVVQHRDNRNEPSMQTVLYCAILKRENFDLVVQKATEVGVAEIHPVITKRTVKLDINLERLAKIAKEAAEQSGRGIVPVVHAPVKLAEALRLAASNEANYFFELDAPTFDGAAHKIKNARRVGVFIGPEGGWDSTEVEAAKTGGLDIVGLGPLTLRGETAAIVATYLVTAALR